VNEGEIMRTFVTLTIALLVTVVPVMAQRAADEAAIKKSAEQYYSARDERDLKAMTTFVDENFQNWTGTTKGKESHEKEWEDRLAQRSKDSKTALVKDVGIDFITPDIAVYSFYTETTGLVDEEGKVQPPLKGRNGRLYVRKDGQWLLRKTFWRRVEEIP
jgi:hypothetical protein